MTFARAWSAFPGLLLVATLAVGCSTERKPAQAFHPAETKAVAFLVREVPAWSRDNGCYSCHNNGDAARALYAAARHGHRIPKLALADTTDWATHPERWEHNQGDPGFSDQRLADLQFASALAASPAGKISKSQNKLAARKVARGQAPDGSWPIDTANAVGSPTTYGATLATYMAWTFLKEVSAPEIIPSVQRAAAKLNTIPLDSVPDAAVRLKYLADRKAPADANALNFLRRAQTSDGGWGPYADSPPEAFDTALALLALSRIRAEADVSMLVGRGREFLFKTQLADGSWPATTRPSGGQSYAQQMSTTAWATMALLETRLEGRAHVANPNLRGLTSAATPR